MFKTYEVQKKLEGQRDQLGQPQSIWGKAFEISGLLDMLTGSNAEAVNRDLYPDASHVLITNGMPEQSPDTFNKIKDPRTGFIYEITYVDNVGEVDDHLEIYLKTTQTRRW